MRLSDFDYALPKELIAQVPAARRDEARLMVLAPKHTEHRLFSDLPQLLPQGALIVVNDTRVIPARLRAQKTSGGWVELLLLEREHVPSEMPRKELWRALAGSKRPIRPGTRLTLLSQDQRTAPPEVTFLGRLDDGTARLECVSSHDGGMLAELELWGETPLPPYIERDLAPADRERYQTIFAKQAGAVAAPTAGLHFTPPLLEMLACKGAEIATVTLHVGPGTFSPIRTDDVSAHVMHEERYSVSEALAAKHYSARATGRPIVAVGTTVVRTLESAYDPESRRLRSGVGRTRLFITPGYRQRTFDLLVTNFHLPRSTLLLLVCAVAGRERILDAYREAILHAYRFFSYGDAMLIFPEAP